MIQTFFSSLRASRSNSNEFVNTRRRHTRREMDRCVVVIHGRTFPVENWSTGGVLLMGDERLFGVNQDIPMTLRFKLRNTILDVDIHGHVIRKTSGKVALKFEAVTKTIQRYFSQVVDDAIAREFANSQAV